MIDAILLKFEQQTSDEGERIAVVTALKLPEKRGEDIVPVVSGRVADMAQWLKERGYRWRVGSSGIWSRGAA